MNTKILLLALLSLMIGFTACDKSEDEGLNIPIPKIKSITYYEDEIMHLINYFEYDSLGRCTKLTYEYPLSSNTIYDVFLYSGDLVIVNRFYVENIINNPDTIHLNEQGLEMWRQNSIYMREYNSNGYLIKSQTAKNVRTPELITYQVSNGNTVKITKEEGTTDKRVTTISSTFLPNAENSIGNENKGLFFNGKQDKNLVHDAHTVISKWPAEYTISYEYEYDAKKRVTKKTAIGGIVKITETYTYYD